MLFFLSSVLVLLLLFSSFLTLYSSPSWCNISLFTPLSAENVVCLTPVIKNAIHHSRRTSCINGQSLSQWTNITQQINSCWRSATLLWSINIWLAVAGQESNAHIAPPKLQPNCGQNSAAHINPKTTTLASHNCHPSTR